MSDVIKTLYRIMLSNEACIIAYCTRSGDLVHIGIGLWHNARPYEITLESIEAINE